MVKLSDFSKACRLCSKVYRVEKLVKIFSNRGISLNLRDSVNAHLPIKVTETETAMPNNICINCIRRLNATNEFFGTVITSEKFFKKLLKKEEERKLNRLREQNPPDFSPVTTIKNEVDNSSSLKLSVSEESVNPDKLDLDSCLEAKTNLNDSEIVSSSIDICDGKLEIKETLSSGIENNRALKSPSKSQDNNITKQLAYHFKEVIKACQIETGEKNLSNNSVEQSNGNDSRYVNIVPKTSHMVLDNRNSNGNIIINVGGSKALSGKDHSVKLPIEVLCCPDCNETVKIYSSEERQLFFEYLKQHNCKNSAESERTIRSFTRYKETYGREHVPGEKKKKEIFDSSEVTKSYTSGKKWPDGDLPADPGPDPTLYENIFEDDVRLDDDFHWPMPKRIRRLHKCASCEFVTKSALRLKTHQKLHRTLDKRQMSHSTTCKHCHKRFETVNDAKKHERLAHVTLGAKNSLCEYCGIMKAQKSLRDHVLKQHTVESEIEMQECDVCGKSFISPTSLYLHKKIHTIEKQHLCDLCGKAFKQRIAMRRHYMLHFPRAPPKFKCNICEKRVTTRGSLRLHMMRHTGEKPQECPECHMVMRHGLKHHMRLHSDEAPFKCVVCGADFKRRDYVRRHMRKHLNETEHRSLECNICNHVFDDIKNFLIHHQNIHRNEIFTQIKIFECKTCSMQFADSLQHKNHQEVCVTTERRAPSKAYVNEVQSCTTISYTKVCGIDNHKDVGADQSHSCVYCDYKNTSAEHREEDTTSTIEESRFQTRSNFGNNKHEESCLRFNEDFRRLKKQQDHQDNDDHIILSDNVMSLGNESSEYSYIDIIEKPNNMREKEILMSVDEQIMTSSSVHVFESPVSEQFNQSSLNSHSQSHIGIHQNAETYTRESISWKEL